MILVDMISDMSDAIREVLLASLLDCVASLELSDHDTVDRAIASEVMGDVTAHLRTLIQPDRVVLTELITRRASAETDPERRQLFEDLPGDLGLLD